MISLNEKKLLILVRWTLRRNRLSGRCLLPGRTKLLRLTRLMTVRLSRRDSSRCLEVAYGTGVPLLTLEETWKRCLFLPTSVIAHPCLPSRYTRVALWARSITLRKVRLVLWARLKRCKRVRLRKHNRWLRQMRLLPLIGLRTCCLSSEVISLQIADPGSLTLSVTLPGCSGRLTLPRKLRTLNVWLRFCVWCPTALLATP